MIQKEFYFFIPTLLSTISFCIFASGAYWCDFISINVEVPEVGNNGWGLWSYERNDVCYYYNDFVVDSNIIYARGFTVMSQIIGGTCLLLMYYSAFNPLPTSVWLSIGVAQSFFCCIFSGLSLQIFHSNICADLAFDEYIGMNLGCGYNRGARCAIAASVMYLLTGMFILLVPPVVVSDNDAGDSNTTPTSSVKGAADDRASLQFA